MVKHKLHNIHDYFELCVFVNLNAHHTGPDFNAKSISM